MNDIDKRVEEIRASGLTDLCDECADLIAAYDAKCEEVANLTKQLYETQEWWRQLMSDIDKRVEGIRHNAATGCLVTGRDAEALLDAYDESHKRSVRYAGWLASHECEGGCIPPNNVCVYCEAAKFLKDNGYKSGPGGYWRAKR